MKVKSNDKSKVELMMTPMIDIVFQLLIFFIMSFKIAAIEGDFNVKMPLARREAVEPQLPDVPPMRVRLTARPNGELAGISLNDQNFSNFRELHQFIFAVIGTDSGPGSRQATAEVELDCDYNLRHSHVVDAITSISGYVGPDNSIVPLVEKIKFAPPKSPS